MIRNAPAALKRKEKRIHKGDKPKDQAHKRGKQRKAPIEAMRVSRRQLNGTPVVKARKKRSGVCWVMIHMPRVRSCCRKRSLTPQSSPYRGG